MDIDKHITHTSLQIGGCLFPFTVLPLRNEPTVGDDTKTYVLVPEASNAANFGDFSLETLANGLFFSGDFGGDGGRVAGADSSIGLLGIGGGVVGEMLDKGALVAPMFRLICISKSPTFTFSSAISVSSQTSNTKASNPLGKVAVCKGFFSNESSGVLLEEASDLDALIASAVFAHETSVFFPFVWEIKCF